jgi:hypothetical protein
MSPESQSRLIADYTPLKRRAAEDSGPFAYITDRGCVQSQRQAVLSVLARVNLVGVFIYIRCGSGRDSAPADLSALALATLRHSALVLATLVWHLPLWCGGLQPGVALTLYGGSMAPGPRIFWHQTRGI